MPEAKGRRGRLRVGDGRRLPFFQVGKAHTLAIAETFEGRRLPIARSIYFAVVEIANDLRTYDVAEATRKELAEVAGVNVRVLDEYAEELVKAGVLRVERHGDEGRANEWWLADPVQAADTPPVQPAGTGAVHAADTGGAALPAPPIGNGQENIPSTIFPDVAGQVSEAMLADATELLVQKTRVGGRIVSPKEMGRAVSALAEFNRQATELRGRKTDQGIGANLDSLVARIRERPSYDAAAHVRLVQSAFRVRWWERTGRQDGRRLTPAPIYGNAKTFENCVQDAIEEHQGAPVEQVRQSRYRRSRSVED